MHPKYQSIDTPEYWDERYKTNEDTWTFNNYNPTFVHLLKSGFLNKDQKILIIGAGKGYDAVEAAKLGFDVTTIDFSTQANEFTRKLAAGADVNIKLINKDIFELNSLNTKYDLIYEYVTICSIIPERWGELLEKIDYALNAGGYFVTVLFPVNRHYEPPPFTVELKDFYNLAVKCWKLVYFQRDIPSIKPRKGNELLLIFKKSA